MGVGAGVTAAVGEGVALFGLPPPLPPLARARWSDVTRRRTNASEDSGALLMRRSLPSERAHAVEVKGLDATTISMANKRAVDVDDGFMMMILAAACYLCNVYTKNL